MEVEAPEEHGDAPAPITPKPGPKGAARGAAPSPAAPEKRMFQVWSMDGCGHKCGEGVMSPAGVPHRAPPRMFQVWTRGAVWLYTQGRRLFFESVSSPQEGECGEVNMQVHAVWTARPTKASRKKGPRSHSALTSSEGHPPPEGLCPERCRCPLTGSQMSSESLSDDTSSGREGGKKCGCRH